MNFSLRSPVPVAPPRARISAGVAISLILHGLLILGYRYTAPAPAPSLPPAQRMTVWLRPLLPSLPDGPGTVPPVARSSSQPARTVNPLDRPAQRAITIGQSKPDTAAEATPASAEYRPGAATGASPAPEEATGRFDMQAALKLARKEASRKDPARAAMPVAQLDDHPLYPEQNGTELGRKIDGATRPSCLKGGSIFSPLIWLMDKKDSGCKF